YLWTMVVADNREPNKVEYFEDLAIRLYRVSYGQKTDCFCGGWLEDAYWMHKEDLHALLIKLGYKYLETEHESIQPDGASCSFLAKTYCPKDLTQTKAKADDH